jgi:4-amino-4-deoxy-L-arabinose transferase-like glycosyltransferase
MARLVRRLMGDRAALGAAVMVAAYPPLWVNDALVMSESLVVLMVAVTLLCIDRYRRQPTSANGAVLGVALGLAALTRAELLLFAPIIVVPLTLRTRASSLRARVRNLAVAGLTCVVVLAPWTIRNLTTFERTVLLTDNFNSVIAGANCDGTYYGPDTGSWDFTCHAQELPVGNESVIGAELRHRGVRYIGDHLDRAPVVALARVGRTFEAFRPMDDAEDHGRPRWVEWFMLPSYLALQAAAVIGARRLRRAGIAIWPYVAVLAIVVITSALSYGITRFRVPWDIAAVVLAAAMFAREEDLPPRQARAH